MARRSSNIPIDGEYFNQFLISTGKKKAEIAETIGRAPSYITNCIKRGYIQEPVLKLFCSLYPIDVDKLCLPEEPAKQQDAEPMTWDDLNMATAIEMLARIEKKLDAILGKGA